jgi:RHS repeat-associated protein
MGRAKRWAKSRAITVAFVAFLLGLSGAAHAEKSGVRPNVISVPAGPGTIKGLGEQFEPSLNTGSATYEIDLDLPAGTAGFAPSLALRYDSGQGDGTVGIGWSFDVGSVQRQTAYGVPRYDDTDRFVWEGQELVPVGGDVYRLKIEGAFLRFRRSPDHWEADARDGTTYRFGVSEGARSAGTAGVYRWALEQVIDVSGNRIGFSYERDRGQLYLTRVDYNQRAGAARNAVDISWQPRGDALTDFRAGFGITTARRLERVVMRANGGQVRRYQLAYEAPTPTSALSRLASVTMFGTDDHTSLPAISFTYSGFDPARQEVQALSNPPAFSLADSNTELADFDGDGLPDLVHAALGRHEVAINAGASWEKAAAISSNPSVQLAANGTELADMNGDGIVDLVSKLAPGAGDFVYFPNHGAGDWDTATRFRNNPAFSFEDPGVRLLDFDGDGLVDVMQTTPTASFYFRNNGDGTWASPTSGQPIPGQTVVFSDPQVRLADMNGDRLVDLVYVRAGSVVYWPSLGWGRWGDAVPVPGAPSAGAEQSRVQLADMNGDGLSDLWLASGTELRIWLQRGDGTLAAALVFGSLPDANPLTTFVRVADMNGSGTADVVWNSPSAGADRSWRYLDVTGGVRPNLLSAIDNGMGRTIQIDYSSTGAMFRMAAAAGHPWTTRLPIPAQVVASVTTSDGRGWSTQEAFVYRDGYYDASTRQFRGFATTKKIEPGNDEEATSIQVHTFDVGATAEALKGAELGIEVQDATGGVLRRETNTYDVHWYATGTDGRTVTGPDRRAHVVDHVEKTATPVTTREEWTYDDYGDVLTHSEWGVVEGTNLLAASDERITTTTYVHDLDRWLLGRPYDVLVTDAAGKRFAEARTYYDGDPFTGLPLRTLGTRGLPTRAESWVEGERFADTSRVQRDEFGLEIATLDPRGYRHEIDYDRDTHRFPVAERSLLDEGKALSFAAGYDAIAGTLSWFVDPAGRKTTFHHSPLLQLAAVVKPGDSDATPTTTFDYVYGNPTSEVISRSRIDVGGGAVLEKHHHYDGLGRDIGLVEQAGDGKTLTSGLKVFGPNGRVVRELEPAFTTDFALGATPAGLAFTAHRYDALGRATRTVLPDGAVTETRFAPLVVEHWDAEDLDPKSPHANTPRIERSNGRGVVQIDERLGSAVLSTKLDRDALGRIWQVVDAAGNATTYGFDGLSRVVALEHPDAGKTTSVYDDAGNLTSRTDARGATVTSTHDGVNRPVTETLTNAQGVVEERVTYHYDSPSPRFPRDAFSNGELTWVEDAAGVEHYRHDDRDHLAEMIRVIDGRDFRVAEQHDGLDRLARVSYPDGRELDYRYNARGLLREVPGILNGIDYDERGLATRREYANGTVTTAHYDAMDRLDALGTTLGGKTIQALALEYDRAGNVSAISDAVRATGALAAARTFGYDDLYRLRTATGPAGTWSYDFDAVGNFQAKTGIGGYVYGATKPHQPTSAGSGDYAFDEAGQLTRRPGSAQTFDAKGRLASVTMDDGTIVSYRYDYSGAVAVKETTGARGHHRTVYVDQLAEERDGELVDYVFAGGLRIARIGGETPRASVVADALSRVPPAAGTTGVFALAFAGVFGLARPKTRRRLSSLVALGIACLVFDVSISGCGGTTSAGPGVAGAIYYHHDHLQGVAFETDDRGEVLVETAFDPYGGDLHPTTEPYAFTGKERDPDTGLYHFGARAYDPKLGLFLSPDPAVLAEPALAIEDPQLLNVYAYARNNPTTHVDHDGRLPHILIGALVGAVIGGGAYLVKAAITNEFSVKGALAATAGGAVAGAVAAATGGASLLVQGAAAGVAGGIAQRGIETGSLSKTLSPKAIASDAAWGAAGAGVGKVAAKVASKVAPKVVGAAKAAMARARSTVRSTTTGPLRASTTAASPKLLSPVPQVDVAWGASEYRHGGLMNGLEHIMYRHGAESGFSNVSRFAEGTTGRDVVNLVDEALRFGTVKATGPGAYTVEHTLGRVIGSNITGQEASSLRVFVRSGTIQTAFPF